mgnify:CR=1 FL=1
MVDLLIGITTVNGPDLVFACLRSLQNFPPSIPYRLLIVNDGSTGVTERILNDIAVMFEADIIHHKNGETPANKGIPEGWNDIVGNAQAHGIPYALILNDDIEFLPNRAIEAALYIHQKNERIGAVGLQPYYRVPSGWIPTWPTDYPMTKPALVPRAAGCSFMTSTAAWEQVGQFDPQFTSHFEDVDYAVRLHQRGYASVNIPQGVQHGWSQTFQRNPELHGHLRLEVSKMKFLKKWGQLPDAFTIPSPRELQFLSPEGIESHATCEFRRVY